MSLLEVVVAIALVGAMFAALASMLSARTLRVRVNYETKATALAEGALAAALALPSSALTDRVSAPLIGFTEKRGQWWVRAQTGAPSAPNVLAIATSSPAIAGTTAALRLITPPSANGALAAAIYVPPSPPSGWRAGLLFRSRDLGNTYRYTFGAATVTLERLTNGVATELYTLSTSAAPDTWTTLAISASGSQLSLSKDGVPLTIVTDSTWGSGDLALVAMGNLAAAFDDVAVTGAATATWRFDADAVGLPPVDWRTLSAADLPGGAGDITIDHPFTGGNLARIKTRIQWSTAIGTQNVTATGYAR